MTEERVKKFIKELNALTVKYGILLHSCGCCNSIILYQLNIEQIPTHQYVCEYDKERMRYQNLRWYDNKSIEHDIDFFDDEDDNKIIFTEEHMRNMNAPFPPEEGYEE